MEISICAATAMELAPLQAMRSALAATGHQFRFCISGIGMLQSTFNIQQHIHRYQPQMLLQIGIAGCFDLDVPLGTVVIIDKEYLGSLGVEESFQGLPETGKAPNAGPLPVAPPEAPVWRDVFDLGLQDPSVSPFSNKALINPHLEHWPWLQQMQVSVGSAVTIDEITTRPERIQVLKDRYRPILESMEGAALHFTGLMHKTPFLQIRGISNYIGERDKTKWQIGPALKAATTGTLQCLSLL